VIGSDRDLIEGLSRHFSGQTTETMKYLIQYGWSACRYLKKVPPENKEKNDGPSSETFHGNLLIHLIVNKFRCIAQHIICYLF
jgi:hypothetical protein